MSFTDERFLSTYRAERATNANQLTTREQRILKLWDIWIHLANKDFYNLLKYLLTQKDWKLWDISVTTRKRATCSFVEKIFKLFNTSPQKFKIMRHLVALRNLKLWDMRSSIFGSKNERPFLGMARKKFQNKTKFGFPNLLEGWPSFFSEAPKKRRSKLN
jgi:hypothetical protein